MSKQENKTEAQKCPKTEGMNNNNCRTSCNIKCRPNKKCSNEHSKLHDDLNIAMTEYILMKITNVHKRRTSTMTNVHRSETTDVPMSQKFK
jgi:hypothetical protein